MMQKKYTVLEVTKSMERTQRLWISLDGGGTKTQVCVCDGDGTIVFDKVFPAMNYRSVSEQVSGKVLGEIWNQLKNDFPGCENNVRGIVLAAAGCDSRQDHDFYLRTAEKTGIPTENLLICNDSEAVYRGLTEESGICLIGGTGSIACAYFKNGTNRRVAGWNPPLSDLGSGYWVGESILRHYLLWLDGLEEEDHAIYRELHDLYYKDGEEHQWTIACLTIPRIAGAAKLVISHREDPLCLEIAGKAQDYLALYVSALHKQAGLGDAFPVVMIGGMLGDEWFSGEVQCKIREVLDQCRITFLRPTRSPAHDGLVFCRRLFKDEEGPDEGGTGEESRV